MVGAEPVCQSTHGSLEQGLGFCDSALRHVCLCEEKKRLAYIGAGVLPPSDRFGDT